MTFRTELLRVADASERRALRLWGAGMPDEEFADRLAVVLAAENQRAFTLADLALAAMLSRRGARVGLLGLRFTDTDRLRKATTTFVGRAAGRDDPEVGLARLARAEPLEAGRVGFGEAMRRRNVPGWTRTPGPNPCRVCASLADGSVLPASVQMFDHPGCACVATPILD